MLCVLLVLVALLLAAGCSGHAEPLPAGSGHTAAAAAAEASHSHDHGATCHQAGPLDESTVAASGKRISAPDQPALPIAVDAGGPEHRTIGVVLARRAFKVPLQGGRQHLVLAQISRT